MAERRFRERKEVGMEEDVDDDERDPSPDLTLSMAGGVEDLERWLLG